MNINLARGVVRWLNDDVILLLSPKDIHHLTGIVELMLGANLKEKETTITYVLCIPSPLSLFLSLSLSLSPSPSLPLSLTGAPFTEKDFSKSTRICCARSYCTDSNLRLLTLTSCERSCDYGNHIHLSVSCLICGMDWYFENSSTTLIAPCSCVVTSA